MKSSTLGAYLTLLASLATAIIVGCVGAGDTVNTSVTGLSDFAITTQEADQPRKDPAPISKAGKPAEQKTTEAPPAPTLVRKDAPALPAELFKYADQDNQYPAHFTRRLRRGASITAQDNTPANNKITNAGATLGRVLFYDRKLSKNDTISCGSCHKQELGFTDSERFSIGFEGKKTGRHSMALSNARYYRRGRYFWDERSPTLEHQVLQPIQDPVEMGMKLDDLEKKLAAVEYYPPLFEAAFGSTEITSERISFALAQFVRSMVSYRSKYDSAYNENGIPDFRGTFTEQEMHGMELFTVVRGANHTSLCCGNCHATDLQVAVIPFNNGLDADTFGDEGIGNGRFKSSSLRNVAVRKHFMHDGRFSTLREVLDFYSTKIQPHMFLDGRLRDFEGKPRRFNLTEEEKDALLAFFDTLTDYEFIKDPKFADPFMVPEAAPAPAPQQSDMGK